eukprot:TRINITY_DN55239_c0_g1_i1.p1 TRINITY_DN55239_c0_g1~~TRINITY_DN55239_c0_g1_i1.p1  ORF type:complete len:756 (+),score=127.98 TRINITY_DN55239_c0_g1_i1:90-2357(+)
MRCPGAAARRCAERGAHPRRTLCGARRSYAARGDPEPDPAQEDMERRQLEAAARLKMLEMRDQVENVMDRVSYTHGARHSYNYDFAELSARTFDYIIVGSGYGGSVMAMRMAQKGYSVLVLDEGRRLGLGDFAEHGGQPSKLFWAPVLGWHGPQRYTRAGPFVLRGASCVGGSSVVASEHMEEAPAESFDTGSWRGVLSHADLAPHYEVARRLLGVAPQPFETPPDALLRDAAKDAAFAAGPELVRPAELAVFLGTQKGKHVDLQEERPYTVATTHENPWEQVHERQVTPNSVRKWPIRARFHQLSLGQDGDVGLRGRAVWADPYYGGVGPARSPCIGCGQCASGCRFNAKNTLDRNYLYLAEQRYGAMVVPDCRVNALRYAEGPDDSDGCRYLVDAGLRVEVPRRRLSLLRSLVSDTKMPRRALPLQLRARNVVVAAGAEGTARLLLAAAEDETQLAGMRRLPIGRGVRTPRCSLAALTAVDTEEDFETPADRDFTRGVTTTSVLRTPSGARVEASHCAPGSNMPRLGFLPDGIRGADEGGGGAAAALGAVWRLLRARPWDALQWISRGDWARATVLLSSFVPSADVWRFHTATGGRLVAERDEEAEGGKAAPDAEAAAAADVRRVEEAAAARLHGLLARPWSEQLRGAPVTAEVVGGACIAASPDHGVVGPDHQVFGHPGLYVVGSAAIGGNLLARNPALTVTAMAERAAALIPDSPRGPAAAHLHDRTPWQEIDMRARGRSFSEEVLRPAQT